MTRAETVVPGNHIGEVDEAERVREREVVFALGAWLLAGAPEHAADGLEVDLLMLQSIEVSSTFLAHLISRPETHTVAITQMLSLKPSGNPAFL